MHPLRGKYRWMQPRRVVWFVAVGADGNVAGGATAKSAILALQKQKADPVQRDFWLNVLDDDERAEITQSAWD